MSRGTTETPPKPAATPPAETPPAAPKAAGPKHHRWGFLSATLVILGLMVVGEAVGR